jgi:hypothetical protein
MKQTTSATLIDEVLQWLNQQALNDTGLEAIARGTCERLAAAYTRVAGPPNSRYSMSCAIRALPITWLIPAGSGPPPSRA